MTKIAAKKFINAIVIFALFTGISFAFADGAPTPTHNPYETGLGDTLNMDTTLIVGGVLYLLGVGATSASKGLLAKIGGRFIS